MTQCSRQRLLFQAHGAREVTAAFDGGHVTSDGGGLLLREVEERFGIVRSFVGCFTDHRNAEAIEFSLCELLLQRVMGLALGYEDLNDHDDLCRDPLLALLADRPGRWGPCCAPRASTPAPARSENWRGSFPNSGPPGRACGS